MDIFSSDNAYLAFSLLSFLMPKHDPEVVLVREPGEREYGPSRPAAELAKACAEVEKIALNRLKDLLP